MRPRPIIPSHSAERAAASNEVRQLVPVDELCESFGEHARQAETFQLLSAPVVDQQFLVGSLFERLGLCHQVRFHRCLPPSRALFDS
jgi:hypothetical protein